MSDNEHRRRTLRDRAEECRRIAWVLMESADHVSYLQLAGAYEALAALPAEQLSGRSGAVLGPARLPATAPVITPDGRTTLECR
jgi:hypothetical protein